MPDLRILIKKKTDGAAALRCIRADGSTTWQRQEGQLGKFFPLHDLTHLAVESVLGFDRAFYGLIAGGWDISVFGDPAGRAQLTDQALLAELIVGYFDLERVTGVLECAADFNAKMQSYLADKKLPPAPLTLSDDQLARVREVRGGLFAQWRALPAGDTLELSFERRDKPPAAPDNRTQIRRTTVG